MSTCRLTVEHVHVHSGGKAIVGSVTQGPWEGGGVAAETAEEPHASRARLAHDTALGAIPPAAERFNIGGLLVIAARSTDAAR